jgi:hypothetical protein
MQQRGSTRGAWLASDAALDGPATADCRSAPLSGPATSYHFSGALSYPIRDYTTASKYVLYDSGAFSLQYASLGGDYVGTYRQRSTLKTARRLFERERMSASAWLSD